jgi:hypothetical protein
MTLDFETITELRHFIGREGPNRIKFVIKLFHLLHFSRNHPGSLMTLGASWCSDGVHFICNSAIMAAFLGLKANSINTNYRDHGFEIVRCTTPELAREFPCLAASTNWKKRMNRKHSFTTSTSLAEVERIPCGEVGVLSSPRRSDPSAFPEIPGPVQEFIHGDHAVEQRVLGIWEHIAGRKGPELLRRAYKDWRQFAGGECVTEIGNFTAALTQGIESPSDIERLVRNAEVLLEDGDSQPSTGLIDFPSYLLFTLRYGFLADAVEVLLQVSEPDGFHPWFRPILGAQAARLLMGCHNRNTWFVRVAETPGTFMLTYKRDASVLLTPISFNPLIPEIRLTMNMTEGTVFAPDWPTLLYSVLRLNSRECLDFEWDGSPESDLTLDPVVAVPLPVTRRPSARSVLT